MKDRIERLMERARDNDKEACYELGMAYYFGDGIPKDNERSYIYLMKARDLGFMCDFSLLMVYAEIHPR